MPRHKRKPKTQQTKQYSPNSWWIGLGLCLLVFVVYSPVFEAGFIWDDDIITTMAPVQSINGLAEIWFNPRALGLEGHYWPVLYSTFWLEHKLWGFAPLGFHLVNLVLHSAVVVLVWRLMLRLAPTTSLKTEQIKTANLRQNKAKTTAALKEKSATVGTAKIVVPKGWDCVAVLTAIVFAIHPVHVESVAWIIGRKDLLATAFGLLTMLYYLRFIASHNMRYYLAALAVFVLAMLSKSVLVTMPVVLALLVWWRRGNIGVATIWQLLPFAAIASAITFADWHYYKSIEQISFDYSVVERSLIAARALWFYLGKLLLPTDLIIIYPHWQTGIGDIWGWAAVAAIVATFCALYYWRASLGRGAAAVALFFAVTLLPVLGFVDYGYMQFSFVADRYQYFASSGIIAATVVIAVHCYYQTTRKWLWGLAVLPLVILAVLTWRQVAVYRNSITFFEHIAASNPNAKSVQYNLGGYLLGAKRYDAALAAYRLALAQTPNSASAHHNIATALQQKGDPTQAIKYYRLAIAQDPGYLMSLNSLAQLLADQHQYQQSHQLLQKILKINPNHAVAHAWLGIVYANTDKMPLALISLNRALELDPTLQEARLNRQKVLAILKSSAK